MERVFWLIFNRLRVCILGSQVRFFFPLARNLQIQTDENRPYEGIGLDVGFKSGFTEQIMIITLKPGISEFK